MLNTSHGDSPLPSSNLVPLILALDHGSVYDGVQHWHVGLSYSDTTTEDDFSALDCLSPLTETLQYECRLHLVSGCSSWLPLCQHYIIFVTSLEVINSEFKFCFG